jgi:hypothetical protein
MYWPYKVLIGCVAVPLSLYLFQSVYKFTTSDNKIVKQNKLATELNELCLTDQNENKEETKEDNMVENNKEENKESTEKLLTEPVIDSSVGQVEVIEEPNQESNQVPNQELNQRSVEESNKESFEESNRELVEEKEQVKLIEEKIKKAIIRPNKNKEKDKHEVSRSETEELYVEHSQSSIDSTIKFSVDGIETEAKQLKKLKKGKSVKSLFKSLKKKIKLFGKQSDKSRPKKYN